MKGQPEQGQDIGLGKKLEPRPVISPDWRAVPGKPHHYEHTRNKNADGSPVKKYAPPVPDAPYKPDPILDWYRRQGLMCDSF